MDFPAELVAINLELASVTSTSTGLLVVPMYDRRCKATCPVRNAGERHANWRALLLPKL